MNHFLKSIKTTYETIVAVGLILFAITYICVSMFILFVAIVIAGKEK
jgi:hypothetical protein